MLAEFAKFGGSLFRRVRFSSTPHAVFEQPIDPSNKSFFSEIISSVSDVKFSHDGRYIMSRDYLTIKVGAARCSAARSWRRSSTQRSLAPWPPLLVA